ncbi:MAG TPA: PIN domain-containing protein [Bryobacteraceae bacterium]|nr:PIN domain-containing protein [Bryobacteraceae bacterium]
MKNSTGSDPLFIDTWGWLVPANNQDPSYRFVLNLRVEDAQRGVRWVTSDYVLDETITHLFAAAPHSEARKFAGAILESGELGTLSIETVNAERFQAAWRLRLRYRDKPRVSFTDLTSFALMRELGIRRVLTGDAHFRRAGLGFVTLP